MIKDEFGNALDAYRETFGEDFPTMDFMGIPVGELIDKVWECIDNGSPIESDFDNEIKYQYKQIATEIASVAFPLVLLDLYVYLVYYNEKPKEKAEKLCPLNILC